MPCPECERWLDGYLQDTLTAEERAAFEAHCAACPSCEDEVQAYRRTERFLASVALPSMADTFWRRQRMAIAKAIRPQAVWQAPALSLLLFSFVIVGYLYAGLDWLVITAGDFLGLAGANTGNLAAQSFDSYDTVILLYVGLFALAMMVFVSDSEGGRRVSHRRHS